MKKRSWKQRSAKQTPAKRGSVKGGPGNDEPILATVTGEYFQPLRLHYTVFDQQPCLKSNGFPFTIMKMASWVSRGSCGFGRPSPWRTGGQTPSIRRTTSSRRCENG